MGNMYSVIETLCRSQGIKVGKLCAELGISRGVMGDLKAGRTKTLSVASCQKIADYFGVTTDYLLGTDGNEKAPAETGKRNVTDDDIKFALFGGEAEITDAMYDEVRNFAAYVKEREQKKKE